MTKIYDAILDRVPYRVLNVVCLIVLAGAALALSVNVASSATNFRSHAFGGQEVVDAHITADGLLRAYSRVSITKCPDDVSYIPIRVSQPGATLESVAFDGRKVSFAPDDEHAEEGAYRVMPGLPENALKSAVMEITWSMPLDKVESGGPNSYQFHLRGAIPISSYTANVILDEGVPYAFGGKFANVPAYSMFWTKHTGRSYFDGEMGTCGIGLVKKEI
ncbi:MAG: hypothetical protein K1Y02_25270 [Candidatus Hydrogenedentes bacterium]|nr:hypothetical protein [Candidatus Hydrogenedentota bacterium]